MDAQDAHEHASDERQDQTGRSILKLGVSAAVVLAVVIGGSFAWRAYTNIENAIVEDQADQGFDVTVDCPESIDWKVGGEFHCVLEADDGTRATSFSMLTVAIAGDVTWQIDS